MLSFLPVWIEEGMRKTLFSRIRLPMALVTTMNSKAATRPRMSLRGTRAWQSTAINASDNCTRICSWLVHRELVDDARDRAVGGGGVKRAEHQVPVSAARRAEEIVSKSRSSPTMTTSGSMRSTRRRASVKLGTSTPTSRWLIIDFLWV